MSSRLNRFPEPEWLQRLFNDDALEGQEDASSEIIIMSLEVRRAIWSLAVRLVGDREANSGTASLGCRIFERYCSDVEYKSKNMTQDDWRATTLNIKIRINLLLAVCIMLASKMQRSQGALYPKSLMRALYESGDFFTLNQIKKAESEVFIAIKFFIPVWNNVMKAFMIANGLDLPHYTMLVAGALMDLIDYKLPLVRERFAVYMASPERPRRSPRIHDADSIQNIHLIASVVVATSRFMHPRCQNLSQTLARWTRTTEYVLDCLSDVIYQYFTNDRLQSFMKSLNSKCPSKRSNEVYSLRISKRQCID